jgi:hypothetical protein
MGVLKPLPLQGRGLERGQSIHSKLFKHPLIYPKFSPANVVTKLYIFNCEYSQFEMFTKLKFHI